MAFLIPFLEEAGSYLLPKVGEAAMNFIGDQIKAHQPREAEVGYMAGNQSALQIKQPKALGTNVTSGETHTYGPGGAMQIYGGQPNAMIPPRPVVNTYQLGDSQPYYDKKKKRGRAAKKSIDTMSEKEVRAKIARLRAKQKRLEEALGTTNPLLGQ